MACAMRRPDSGLVRARKIRIVPPLDSSIVAAGGDPHGAAIILLLATKAVGRIRRAGSGSASRGTGMPVNNG